VSHPAVTGGVFLRDARIDRSGPEAGPDWWVIFHNESESWEFVIGATAADRDAR
jgi:hypothetical protein